jgi:hypothetical protein
MHTLLTRSDFENAVKEALRHYTRTDLLTGNALLHAQALTRSASGAATPSALRTVIAESAKALFVNERDQRLYRVLDLTYFNPARNKKLPPSGWECLLAPIVDNFPGPSTG